MPANTTPTVAGSLASTDLVQVSVLGEQDDQAVNNVWWVSNALLGTGTTLTGAAAITELNTIAAAMRTFYAGFAGITNLNMRWFAWSAKKVISRAIVGTAPNQRGVFTFDIQGLDNTEVVGTSTGDVTNTFTAVSMQLLTSDTGRHFRGGKRFAGVTEADTDDNELTPTAYASWAPLGTDLVADWLAARTSAGCTLQWPLVVAATNLLANTPATVNNVPTSEVQRGIVSRILGSQTSRKKKRYYA